MKTYTVKELTLKLCPLLFLLLFSCGPDSRQPLSVKLTMTHMPASVHTAYLDQITPVATYIIDTGNVEPLKGTVAFTYYPQGSEGLYAIRMDDSTRLLLVLHNADVTISGDYHHPAQLQIHGSPSSSELQGFLDILNRQNHQLDSLILDYYNLKKAHIPDTIVERKAALIAKSRRSLLDTILHEARTTTSPANAVFALSLLDNSGSWDEGKAIFEGLEQRFPHNQLVKQATEAYHRKMNDMGRSVATGVGDTAPDISYPDTSGRTESLHDFRGKYVLLDFWASWCAPCRAENPNVVKAWKLFRDRNFAILGVSLDTKKTSWEKAINQDKLTWHHISDLKGWNSTPAALYGVESIPANFLISPEGKILATNLEGDSLIHELEQVLPVQ